MKLGSNVEYDKVYETDYAIIRIVNPESIIGRKITKDEVQKVIDEVAMWSYETQVGLRKKSKLELATE